jgi:hypothetical protein
MAVHQWCLTDSLPPLDESVFLPRFFLFLPATTTTTTSVQWFNVKDKHEGGGREEKECYRSGRQKAMLASMCD